MTLSISSIQRSDRIRSREKYGDIKGLAESIKDIGTIQPVVISRRVIGMTDGFGDTRNSVPEYEYTLVAGDRRLTAIESLGFKELHHGVTLDPSRPGFVFVDELTEASRVEAELDENLHRLNMDWVDEVLAIEKIHKLKQQTNFKWGVRQTAAVMKGSDRTKVSHALRIAKLLRAGDAELLACKNMSDAIATLIKRKEDEALAEMQKRVIAKQPVAPKAFDSASLDTFLDTFNIPFRKEGDAISSVKTKESSEDKSNGAPTVQPTSAPTLIPFSTMFRLGDSMELLKSFPPSSFDHIVTDPPYGIDMSNFDEKQVASVCDTHDVDQNISMFEPFLREAFRILKPQGFCVFFYDLDHHEKLQYLAGSIGFRVQRWPFVAAKLSTCKNSAAQYNLTKNYECAMFLRKDAQTVLRHVPKFALNNSSWKAYDFSVERELYANPFAKPFELWKDIFDMIAFTGQTVLDPFCGEMSSCRAAANCGLIPSGIEIDEKHYNRGLNHMRGVFGLIHRGNVEFV